MVIVNKHLYDDKGKRDCLMLNKRQNLIEVMKGGTPDRFVNQYEAFALIMGVPVSPYKGAIYGGEPTKDGWGVTKIWPVGTPGAFPLHDEEHLVCKDITHWRDYVKAPRVDFPDSAWEDVVRRTEVESDVGRCIWLYRERVYCK